MTAPRRIDRAHILPPAEYGAVRKQRRRAIAAIKRNRRVDVGPFATFYFENYDTMCHQVHEMLYIERGGEAQIEGELAAYNPLVPNGRELVATLMLEIDEPVRRDRRLSELGGIETTVGLEVAGEIIAAVPERDVERTSEAGKASSVHFLHFPFSTAQVASFRRAGSTVTLAIGHPNYGHMAVLPEAVRRAMAADFD